MNLWIWLLLSCVIAFITKLAGFLIPATWLNNPKIMQITNSLTVGLLASLVTLNTLAQGQNLAFDARIISLLTAAIMLYFRAPFLLTVSFGALSASLVRFFM